MQTVSVILRNREARSRYGRILGLLAICLAGAALRLWGLGRDGLSADEAQAVFIAARAFPAGISGTLALDAHPPLFFFLVHFWGSLWGTNEFGIRLLSALLGVAAIPLLYMAAKAMFNRNVALLAAGIGAFLPMHVVASRQVSPYTLLALLSLLSLWTLHDAVLYNMRRYWVGWVLASTLMIYTHNWGIWVFAAENLFVIWHWLIRDRRVSALGAWMASLGGVGLLYLPWLPTLLEQMRAPAAVTGLWANGQNSSMGNFLRIFNDLTSMTWPGDKPLPYMILLLIGTLSFSAARERISVRYDFSPAADLSVLALLFPIVAGVLAAGGSRDLIPSYAALAVFAPLCFLLARALSGLRPTYALMALAILALLFWYKPLGNIYARPASALREVAQYVEDTAGPGDVLIIAPDYLATSFNFYFDGIQPQVAFPQPPGRVEVIARPGWRAQWEDGQSSVFPTLDFVSASGTPEGRVWFIASLDTDANNPYFGQIRIVKNELDARYDLVQHEGRFRKMASESADIFVYQKR